MPNENRETLRLPEADARRLLLAQAIDLADEQGRLVGASEREALEREALAATGDPAQGRKLDARAFLLERARRLLDLVSHRQPRLAALHEPSPWQRAATWLLPLAALLAGVLVDRIDNPRQVNLLSPPLLAFLLWNLGVYVALLVLALRPMKAAATPWFDRWTRLWTRRAAGGLRGAAGSAFRLRWWQVAGALEGQRWGRILHVAAAAWAVGVAVSIVAGGVVREYRVGWESTLLDLPQVHAFLSVLFAPVVALLPLDGFTQAEVARLHFASGADVGREEARRWVGLYVALLGVAVVLPRLLLATWAGLRERHLAGAVAVDLSDPYFEALLGRVQPARLRLGLVDLSGEADGALRVVLRQAAGQQAPPADAAASWTVLATARGDVLECQPTRVAPPSPPPPAAPTAGWWPRLLLPGRASEPPAAASAVAHVLLVTCHSPADLERALPGLRAAGRPVLLMAADGADAAYAALLRNLGSASAVLSLHELPTWRQDARLLEVLARLLPPWQQGGLQRLQVAWQERAQARLEASMRLLAQELFDTAADVQALGAWGLRQIASSTGREAGKEAREQARAFLLGRLHERREAADRQLLQLHAVTADPDTLPEPALALAWQPQQAVDARQAGLAGAASGAAMGATLDLMTGVMTLGAASALGGLIGGGAAFVAAAWRNTTGGANAQGLALSDEMLLALVELALLRYLAAVHAGRTVPQDAREGWPTRVRRDVQERRGALEPVWSSARQRSEGEQAIAALTGELQGMALRLVDEG